MLINEVLLDNVIIQLYNELYDCIIGEGRCMSNTCDKAIKASDVEELREFLDQLGDEL